ncbi:MAG: VOC family protein [Beduini sp.]|uniref:VOC family protein n=1 Tax=Beduini sp. TaxID=1922300 RepID=UPI0011CA0235
MIKTISKITLYVKDQEEAERFWVEKLDFKVKMKQPMGENHYWLEVCPKDAETSFVLYNKDMMKKQNPNTSLEHPSILLSSPDVMFTFQMLSDRGVKVDPVIDMPYGKMFTFYDQDGNAYLLREDK